MKKEKRFKTTDDIIYAMLIGILLTVATGAAVLSIFHLKVPSISCVMRHTIGLYCPGCGGTRAFWFLLHGQIGKSFFYHPVVPYASGFLLIYLISQTLTRVTKGKVPGLSFRMIYCYIGVAVLVGNFLWKNYYLVVKGITLIP